MNTPHKPRRIIRKRHIQALHKLDDLDKSLILESHKAAISFLNKYLLIMFALNAGAASALLRYNAEKFFISIYSFTSIAMLFAFFLFFNYIKFTYVNNIFIRKYRNNYYKVASTNILRMIVDTICGLMLVLDFCAIAYTFFALQK